jgi:hypothetical protein
VVLDNYIDGIDNKWRHLELSSSSLIEEEEGNGVAR